MQAVGKEKSQSFSQACSQKRMKANQKGRKLVKNSVRLSYPKSGWVSQSVRTRVMQSFSRSEMEIVNQLKGSQSRSKEVSKGGSELVIQSVMRQSGSIRKEVSKEFSNIKLPNKRVSQSVSHAVKESTRS